MKTTNFITWLGVLLTVAVLTGCGGGGGSGDSPARQTGSSDWDSMVWDRDNWS